MAINYNYSENIKCMSCGSRNIKTNHSPSGILYCTCESCGYKFVAQAEGVNFLDEYIFARAQIFKALEMSSYNNVSVEKMQRELENLVVSYAVLAEIDTIYYWYKIVLITKNFTDYSRLKEAENEYLKIPKNNIYLITADDALRVINYQKQYNAYIENYHSDKQDKKNKSKKKRKLIAALLISFMVAILIGGCAGGIIYKPAVGNTENNITIEYKNSTFGLFEKFGVQMQVDSFAVDSEKYLEAGEKLKDCAVKYNAYNLQFVNKKGEVKVKKPYTATMPLPDGYILEKIAVFAIASDGTIEEVESEVNQVTKTLSFSTDKTGIIAVVEKPYVVTFNSNGGREISAFKVEFGDTIKLPEGVRKGYTFNGWYLDDKLFDESQPIKADITLNAKWTANTYQVFYYVDGVLKQTQNVVFDSNFEMYKPVKTGYIAEWYCDGSLVTEGAWTIDKDARLDVKWTPVTITLTFNNDNRDEPFRFKAVYDNALPKIENLPVKCGYVFSGYYTKQNGAGTLIYRQDGTGAANSDFVANATLYAKWVVDSRYSGYTFLETESDLSQVRSNPANKFLLVYDIDLKGQDWTPFPDFSGTFDGCGNSIYNFNIKSGNRGKVVIHMGLFNYVSGTVKNLQVGKMGYNTNIELSQNYVQPYAGMLTGKIAEGALIENCHAINGKIDLATFAQDSSYKNDEWILYVGGICGYQTGNSTISRCYAENMNINVKVKTRYNNIKAYPRCGGIVGGANSEKAILQDCLSKRCNVYSEGEAIYGNIVNSTGKPKARAGGIIGYALSTSIIRCVAVNNEILAKNIGGDTACWGSIAGETGATKPTSLVRVMSTLQYSGSNKEYPGSYLATDSYADLVAIDKTFDNGYWISDNGKIMLNFKKIY